MTRCPDDARCWHRCRHRCWRVRTCGPLSGVFPRNEWPEDLDDRPRREDEDDD